MSLVALRTMKVGLRCQRIGVPNFKLQCYGENGVLGLLQAAVTILKATVFAIYNFELTVRCRQCHFNHPIADLSSVATGIAVDGSADRPGGSG